MRWRSVMPWRSRQRRLSRQQMMIARQPSRSCSRPSKRLLLLLCQPSRSLQKSKIWYLAHLMPYNAFDPDTANTFRVSTSMMACKNSTVLTWKTSTDTSSG